LSTRSVSAGQSIYLRAKFKDDLGENAVASGVALSIFEPDIDEPLEMAEAFLNINDPTYLGEGIYEYDFSVPDGATEGVWTDLWSGVLNSQLISGVFNFEVQSAGEIVSLGDQLVANDLVEVTLTSGIQATDGTYLTNGYTFEFMTNTSPSYSEVRKVRLEVGSFIGDLPDTTIQTAILEASLEADQLSFEATQNTNFFAHARREWTTCKVAFTLLDNVTSHALRSKTLADLRVEYDTNAIVKTMMRIMDCIQKWEPQIIAGGYAKTAQQPLMVIKGELEFDRPAAGRLWSSTDSSISDRYPAANETDKESLSRRYEKIFRHKKKFW